jgi:hypothetical protein
LSTPVNRLVVDHDPAERSGWRSMSLYVLIACAGMWVVCLPLWWRSAAPKMPTKTE